MATFEDLKKSIGQLIQTYESIPRCQMTPDQEKIFDALLVIISENQHSVNVLKSGYFKLPVVPKDIEIGERGGAFYYNEKGNKIWLKRKQKMQCREGKLKGATQGSCPQPIGGYFIKRKVPIACDNIT
jgi:hypothetical protein